MDSNLKDLRSRSMSKVKGLIRDSVGFDQLIIHAINTYEDLDKQINSVVMRLKDFVSLSNPSLVRDYKDPVAFLSKYSPDILAEKGVGMALSGVDKDVVSRLHGIAKDLVDYRVYLKQYIEDKLMESAPNLCILAGGLISSKLLREARSLKRLASMQSSTIQLLGAEKALFRHLKTGAKPPKYGFILQHPFVSSSRDKGKSARILADKIALCARLDFFGSQIKAYEYIEELESKK